MSTHSRTARRNAISAAMVQIIMPRPSAIAESLAQHDWHLTAHVRDFRSAQIDDEDGMVLVAHAGLRSAR